MTAKSIIVRVYLVCIAACAVMAQSSDLSGIAHVALRVADLEKSRTFYEKLGFEQAFQFDQDGKVTQAFIKINDNQFIELYPRTEEAQAIGFMHVCYEAEKIDEVRAAYAKRGLAPTEVKKARAGNLLFVLHDPENGLVEYTQYLPGSLHSEDRGKHLGEHRIATRLEDVAVPVKDSASEALFYVQKLGFHESKRPPDQALLVPGSRDRVSLISTQKQAEAKLGFAVASLRRTKLQLRSAGLVARDQRHSIAVDDPDGNSIVFERSSEGR
jgi:catechol 2,3-dioxygenase-like lactoylglutathione lyase family enzyme